MKVKIILNMEEGYRVDMLDMNGFVSNSIEIGSDELPTLMRELCEKSGEDVDKLLDTLRQAYELLKLKSITFKIKE